MLKNKKLLPRIIIIAVATIAVIIAAIFIVRATVKSNQFNKTVQIANDYLANLDYKSAIASYKSAIEINPNNVEAYLGLADAYIGLEDYDSAISVLNDGLAVLPDNAELTSKASEVQTLVDAKIAEEQKLAEYEEELAKEKQEISDNEEKDTAETDDSIDEFFGEWDNEEEYSDDHVFSAINGQVNTWELPHPDAFIEGETMTFTPEGTTSDAEWIEVVYTMGSEGKNQLKEITITSPDGTVYYPDGLSVGAMGQCIYGFHVGQGMTGTGEWTVTWTAKALIGEMEVCYEKDEFWQSYYKVDMVFDD